MWSHLPGDEVLQLGDLLLVFRVLLYVPVCEKGLRGSGIQERRQGGEEKRGEGEKRWEGRGRKGEGRLSKGGGTKRREMWFRGGG